MNGAVELYTVRRGVRWSFESLRIGPCCVTSPDSGRSVSAMTAVTLGPVLGGIAQASRADDPAQTLAREGRDCR